MKKSELKMKIENNKQAEVKDNFLKAGSIPTLDKYAIIQTGGKQYFVLEGKTIAIEKIEGVAGNEVIFNEVLLKRTNLESCEIGQPFLKEPIKAVIVKQIKGPKIIVFKFRRREKYRRKKGHRQNYTVVRIGSI